MSEKVNLKEMLSKNVQQSGILLAFVVIVVHLNCAALFSASLSPL